MEPIVCQALPESLTLEELIEMRACTKARLEFEKLFGAEAKLKTILSVLHEHGWFNWEAWLLAQKPELALALLNIGANVNADDDHALVFAIKANNKQIVKILLERGARVNARSDTVLEAVILNDLEMVDILRQNGANILLSYEFSIKCAERNNNTSLLEFLREWYENSRLKDIDEDSHHQPYFGE